MAPSPDWGFARESLSGSGRRILGRGRPFRDSSAVGVDLRNATASLQARIAVMTNALAGASTRAAGLGSRSRGNDFMRGIGSMWK